MNRTTASLGDLHWRGSAPVGRIDDFTEAMWRKLTFMVDYCNENSIMIMFLPGDLFDSVNASSKTLVRASVILSKYLGTILAVYGNHDLRNHNMKSCADTPLGLLCELLPNLHIAGEEPFRWKGYDIYGTSWEQPIPVVDPSSKSVLLIHKMIIDKKLWPGQKPGVDGKGINLLRKTNFQAIISGDNHQQFVLSYKDRWLINSGSMMRTTVKQIDATPGFYIYDLKKNKKPKRIEFPINKDAFDIEKLEAVQEQSAVLDDFTAFIEVITEGIDGDSISFTRVYRKLLKRTKDADLLEYSNELFKEV